MADFQPSTSSETTDYIRFGIEGRLVKVLMLRAGTEQGINDLDDEKYTVWYRHRFNNYGIGSGLKRGFHT